MYPYNSYYMQRQEVLKVNGEAGANNLNIAPNSSVLALDMNNPILFLIETDGSGYKSVSAYTIEPYMPTPPVDVNDLVKRITALEKRLENESDNPKDEQ